MDLIRDVTGMLERESKLIRLPSHGRQSLSEIPWRSGCNGKGLFPLSERGRYRRFSGDYVDRGDFSRENVDTLLQAKWEHPQKIFLLAGNHEAI